MYILIYGIYDDHVMNIMNVIYLVKVADQFEFSSNVYCHDLSRIATTHSLVSVTSQSNKVRLLDLKTGAAVHTLRGHKQSVLTTKWSTKDEFICATGRSVILVYTLAVFSST